MTHLLCALSIDWHERNESHKFASTQKHQIVAFNTLDQAIATRLVQLDEQTVLAMLVRVDRIVAQTVALDEREMSGALFGAHHGHGPTTSEALEQPLVDRYTKVNKIALHKRVRTRARHVIPIAEIQLDKFTIALVDEMTCRGCAARRFRDASEEHLRHELVEVDTARRQSAYVRGHLFAVSRLDLELDIQADLRRLTRVLVLGEVKERLFVGVLAFDLPECVAQHRDETAVDAYRTRRRLIRHHAHHRRLERRNRSSCRVYLLLLLLKLMMMVL